MADTDLTTKNPTAQIERHLGKVRAGFLGVEGTANAPQPMTPFWDASGPSLWFLASGDTDLVRDIGQGAEGNFTFTSPDQDFYAALRGPLRQSEDIAKLDELWSIGAEAWFEGGRDGADVVLIEMPLRLASLWSSTSNRAVFGLEVARAALNPAKTPDVGAHVHVDFVNAA